MRSVRNKRSVKVTVTAHIRYDNKESLKAAIKDITENIYYYMYCEGEFNYLTQCKGGKLKEIIKYDKSTSILKGSETFKKAGQSSNIRKGTV